LIDWLLAVTAWFCCPRTTSFGCSSYCSRYVQ